MKQLRYQNNAVEELVNITIQLLAKAGNRHVLVFKAPTGAGKTVMASDLLMRLNQELKDDPESPVNEVAYIWIAPNKLHEQSYFKMKNYFTESRELHPVIYDDLDHSSEGYIKPGEILFVNWESINKDNALMIRDSENSSSLYDLTKRTQEQYQIPIIAIIDEEHMFGSRLAKKSDGVLKHINPKIEIRISATPLDSTVVKASGNFVDVPRQDVINEGMIKRGVTINPDYKYNPEFGSLNQHMIYLALKKREELAEAYRKLNIKINPLLLIQLPNDGEKMSSDDNSVKEEVISTLSVYGISADNGKLGIWLSGEKTENLKDIANHNDMTEVLLFKQAIALGWDCPRAAVLLIFRDLKSVTFSAQTVGRILRMPEQKHYEDDRLNHGYVYTNLSKDIIEIVKDDMNYLSALYAKRRENLNNVSLVSEYSVYTSAERNRLGSDFKKYLVEAFERQWLVKNETPSLFSLEDLDEDPTSPQSEEEPVNQAALNRKKMEGKIRFDIPYISTDVISDLDISGEVGEIKVTNKGKYISNVNELELALNAYCKKWLGGRFEKISIKVLAMDLVEIMEELFEIFESDAYKVILYHLNRPKFEHVVMLALDRYIEVLHKRQADAKQRGFEKYNWEVPADRLYPDVTHQYNFDIHDHALTPFVKLIKQSDPETRFEDFLESNSRYIDWWYKNGDSGKQHYSISYITTSGEKSLFYVDFIIRMKNGQIFLFDTKTPNSDSEGANKHNALIDYVNSPENTHLHLLGGVIVEEGERWLFSRFKIENNNSTSGWDAFFPDEYQA